MSCSADCASPRRDGFAHLAPGGERRLALRERRCALRASQEELADLPLAGLALLDRDVLDGGLARAVVEDDLAAEHLGDDPHLAAALLEAAQVDETGRDDLAAADRGDPADRDEDAALARDLDDETDHTRGIVLAVHDEDVARLADPIAGGVEDGAPGESGDEDSRCAHGSNLVPEGPSQAVVRPLVGRRGRIPG